MLAAAAIATTDVADLIGGSAILGHRVVTSSREVHAGLLARPSPKTWQSLTGSACRSFISSASISILSPRRSVVPA